MRTGALRPLGDLLDSSGIDIQRAAAAALANLALADENQARIAEELGLSKIIGLARSPDVYVQQHAAGAIANLAFENPTMEVRGKVAFGNEMTDDFHICTIELSDVHKFLLISKK